MRDESTILVTGVAGYWGRRLAQHLLDEPNTRVIGLDDHAPTEKIPGLDFVQADVRNPLLVELLRDEQVEVCCHLKFISAFEGVEMVSEVNVQGAKKVVGACAAAQVEQVVLRSSTLVYGAYADNPAFLKETSTLRGPRQAALIRDLIEIESFAAGFRRQDVNLKLTLLRFANIVGPTADTPMTRFLKLPAQPILLGFDPLLQFVHENDVVEAMKVSVNQGTDGIYNIAAADPVPLSRVLRLAGGRALPIFHPLAYRAVGRMWGPDAGSERWAPLPWDYLRYRWIGDLSRMEEALAFRPRYSAAETLEELGRQRHTFADGPEAGKLAEDEAQLRKTLRQRREVKEKPEASADPTGGDKA